MPRPRKPAASGSRTAPLSEDDVRLLSQALRTHEPWLEWSGKAEEHRRRFFEVDPVALHFHERVSTQAILDCPRRTDVARDLFADPELEYREAVKFYQHDVDWANREDPGGSVPRGTTRRSSPGQRSARRRETLARIQLSRRFQGDRQPAPPLASRRRPPAPVLLPGRSGRDPGPISAPRMSST